MTDDDTLKKIRRCLKEAEDLDRQGQWNKASDLYAEVLQGTRHKGEEWTQAHVMRRIGEIKRKQGDSLEALRLFHGSRRIFQRLGDKKNLSYLFNNIGLVHLGRGRWRTVQRYFEKALEIAKDEGEAQLEGQIFNNLGIMFQIRGASDRAIEYFLKAMASYKGLDYGKGIAQTYNNIGMSYRDRNRWDKARLCYKKSLRISEKLGERNLTGITSLNIAMALIHLEQPALAKEYCDKAYDIFKELDDKLGLAESYLCFGIICRVRKERRPAKQYLRKSVQLNRQIKNRLGLAEVYRELALFYQDEGKNKQVFQLLGKSFEIFRELRARQYVKDIDGKIKELEEIYFRITKEMGEEVESKDTYTYGHCHRVARYSIMLAKGCGLSENEMKAILVGAFLHDLGKVKISKELLCKPKKLTPDEYLTIMKHPGWGVDMLESVEFPWEVKPIILHHQERFDGKGYPDGLEGGDIPLNARIIAIADFFDALTTDRPYRQALDLDEALSLMELEKGRILDPDLFDAFKRLIGENFLLGNAEPEKMGFKEFREAINQCRRDGPVSGEKTAPLSKSASP